ncbi:MAG: phosphatidate cytidylyltransferase [Clostridiales Family XIII bacterium]|jgi:phosphatidate cytidylyltransferase|nr:phosphatidate cytidylyltransferase [Clostridiales Family XIII bacterium]
MKTRIKSGLLMAPMLAVVWVGGYVLLAACVALSVFAVREFYRAFETACAEKGRPVRASRKVAVASIILLYCLPLVLRDGYLAWAVITVAMCFALLFFGDGRGIADSLVTMAGLFYVALFIYFIYAIDLFYDPMGIASLVTEDGYITSPVSGGGEVWDSGFSWNYNLFNSTNGLFCIHGFRYNWVWLVIFSAFATDIFAYFTGRAIGRRKLAPVLSPRKTVEGSIGGVAGSVIVCGLFGHFAMPEFFAHCIVIGVLGGVVSQLGDITASAIKRKLGIKDYGNLIPGHGGLLDRIDSLIFTAPLVFIYLSAMAYWESAGDLAPIILNGVKGAW